MREEPGDGVVDDPWARPPGGSDGHRPGDWGGEPEAPPAGHTGPLVSPTPRLRLARFAVAAAAVLSGIEGLSSVWALAETRSLTGDEPRGGDTRVDELTVSQDAIDRFNAASGVDGIVALVALLALIASAVFVIRWQNVVLRNQQGLGVDRPRYSPVAAGFSWFVPIWSLFGPKRAMNDAWRAAAPATAGSGTTNDWLLRAVPTLFSVWWAAWLVCQLVGNVLTRLPGDTLAGQTLIYGASIVSCVATVVAGVLFVLVMERITGRHDERITERHEARRHEAPAAGTA
ncbi:unannotated protein [freshwater metagenome]|uniref:Unannotated protein n=1 Tax=freshwater metagenome TaxID=449393 RepID=A0A6J7IH16_9ZZZZ|nr:DUF4328 domain-containing protein [Actinomycetota bacterium]